MANNFAPTLLHWFQEHGRDLPWRQTRDPYAIWLSEIILQQTQVKQGWAYWERFMKRWPKVELLAAATEDEVLREWQGLGYYSRARNLHTAARQIVEMGGFPTTLEGIKSLKGVGDYTGLYRCCHRLVCLRPACRCGRWKCVSRAESPFWHLYTHQHHRRKERVRTPGSISTFNFSPFTFHLSTFNLQPGHHGLWRYAMHPIQS